MKRVGLIWICSLLVARMGVFFIFCQRGTSCRLNVHPTAAAPGKASYLNSGATLTVDVITGYTVVAKGSCNVLQQPGVSQENGFTIIV